MKNIDFDRSGSGEESETTRTANKLRTELPGRRTRGSNSSEHTYRPAKLEDSSLPRGMQSDAALFARLYDEGPEAAKNNEAKQDGRQRGKGAAAKVDSGPEETAQRLVETGDRAARGHRLMPAAAREAYGNALSILIDAHGPEDGSLVPVLDRLGSNTDSKDAIKYQEHALRIMEKVLPGNDPALAVRHIRLAQIFNDSKLPEKAREHFEKSRAIWNQVPQARSEEAKADGLRRDGDVSFALQRYLDEEKRIERTLGRANPLAARLEQKAGFCYLNLEKPDLAKAETSFSNSLQSIDLYYSRSGQNGPGPEEIPALLGLAAVEAQRHKLDPNYPLTDAVQYIKRALDTDFKANGKATISGSDPQVLQALLTVHSSLMDPADQETATRLSEKFLVIEKHICEDQLKRLEEQDGGKPSKDALETLGRLVQNARGRGDNDDTFKYLTREADMIRAFNDDASTRGIRPLPETGSILQDLGRMLATRGNVKESIKTYEELLRFDERIGVSPFPAPYHELSQVYERDGQLERAIDMERHSREAFDALFRPLPKAEDLGQVDERRPRLEETTAFTRSTSDLRIALLYEKLADVSEKKNDPKGAEVNYRNAETSIRQSMEDVRTINPFLFRQRVSALAEFYRRRGRTAEADKLLQLEKIPPTDE